MSATASASVTASTSASDDLGVACMHGEHPSKPTHQTHPNTTTKHPHTTKQHSFIQTATQLMIHPPVNCKCRGSVLFWSASTMHLMAREPRDTCNTVQLNAPLRHTLTRDPVKGQLGTLSELSRIPLPDND